MNAPVAMTVPQERIGPYRVTRRLGAGGMGVVYEGYDDRLDRPVALKRLRADSEDSVKARARFRREAQAVARLRHTAIVQVYDWVEAEDSGWIVMEMVDGRPLKELLESGALPCESAVRFARDVASGLAAAHAAGIVHRDLKAGNVMVTRDGEAKILDFGIAKRAPRGARQSLATVTEDGRVLGTVTAMSPEQARGHRVDHRSDLFSLGTLLYEMTTGRSPFEGQSSAATLNRICTWSQKPPAELDPQIPEALSSLIDHLLEKDPAHRPQSALEVKERLESILGTFSPRPAPPPAGDPTFGFSGRTVGSDHSWEGSPVPGPSGPRYRRVLAASLAVAAAALVAVLGWRRQDPPAARAGLPVVGSLVAMPCQVLDGAEPFLTDAIPSTLSTQLGQVEGLDVMLPPTALDVDRVGGDLFRIAVAYGVDAMVLSTVGMESGELALSFNLVHVASRELLWSQEYGGPLSEYLGLARRAAGEIRSALDRGKLPLGTWSEPPGTAAAEIELQQGRYYSNLYRNLGRPEDRERALAAFGRVLELEPRHADAAAQIAATHAASLPTGVSILEVLPEIRSWSERALAIDPRTSTAWAALSEVEGGRKPESYRKKLEYALKAATYGPRDGYAHRQLTAPLFRRSLTLALAAAREASRIDPLVLISPLNEALCLTGLGRRSESMRRIEEALEIEPGMPFGLMVKARLLNFDDLHREALDLARRELEPLADRGLLHPAWVAAEQDLSLYGLAVRRGDADAADATARRLTELALGRRPFPRWQQSTMGVPILFARHGRTEAAVRLLQARSRLGIVDTYDLLLFCRDLQPVRGDARYQEVLSESRTRFEDMLAILEEARAEGELPPYLEKPLAGLLQEIRKARAAL